MTVRFSLGALAIRCAVIVLAAAAIALVPHPSGPVIGFAIAGTVLAVWLPNRAGALVVAVAALVGWVAAYGTQATAPLGRAAAFAIALYLVHVCVALAASVPVGAYVQPKVVTTWALNSLPGVAAAALAGAFVAALGRPGGSLALDVAGLAGALAAAATMVWLARSRR